jgi:hypothetical protein
LQSGPLQNRALGFSRRGDWFRDGVDRRDNGIDRWIAEALLPGINCIGLSALDVARAVLNGRRARPCAATAHFRTNSAGSMSSRAPQAAAAFSRVPGMEQT